MLCLLILVVGSLSLVVVCLDPGWCCVSWSWQEVRAGKGGLLCALPQRLHKDLDHYFSRTVECVTDLRDLLYKGGARLLLPVGARRFASPFL